MKEFEDDMAALPFERRFHLLQLDSHWYCLFVSLKGLHYLPLEGEEIAIARKIKMQVELSAEEKAGALNLLYKLAVQNGSL